MKNLRKGWINWWWVYEPTYGPFVKTTWTTRRQTARELQDYDRGNEWKVGRVHRRYVTIEEPSK